jgi:hypothetical protein
MTATRKHLIRRLSRLTGIPARRIGLAARRAPLTKLAEHALRLAYPQGLAP